MWSLVDALMGGRWCRRTLHTDPRLGLSSSSEPFQTGFKGPVCSIQGRPAASPRTSSREPTGACKFNLFLANICQNLSSQSCSIQLISKMDTLCWFFIASCFFIAMCQQSAKQSLLWDYMCSLLPSLMERKSDSHKQHSLWDTWVNCTCKSPVKLRECLQMSSYTELRVLWVQGGWRHGIMWKQQNLSGSPEFKCLFSIKRSRFVRIPVYVDFYFDIWRWMWLVNLYICITFG